MYKSSIFIFIIIQTCTTIVLAESDLIDKYFRIQSAQSKRYFNVLSPSSPSTDNVKLENHNSEGQVWVIHPTAGFPFRDGNFSRHYKISSKSKDNTLAGQSSWRLTFVKVDPASGDDVLMIMKPYHDICVVELDDSTGIDFEDCDKTRRNKLWTFHPIGVQEETQDGNADFDANLSNEIQ